MGIFTENGNVMGSFSWRKMFAFSGWLVFMSYNIMFFYNSIKMGQAITDIPKGVQILLGVIFSFYFGKDGIKGFIDKIGKKKSKDS